MTGLETLEACPDCGEVSGWQYDSQTCARCAAPHDAAWSVGAEIVRERVRQVIAERFAPEKDDEYGTGELSGAAASYALNAAASLMTGRPGRIPDPPPFFRFARAWWKPRSPREDLIRAAALIVAEIERLGRAAGKGRP